MTTSHVTLETRASLLIRLRDEADREAWTLFVELYAPLVQAFLRRKGLQEVDVFDVVQDVMLTVARKIGTFQHQNARPGSFRCWLYSVVRNRMVDFWRRERRQTQAEGDSRARQRLEQIPTDEHTLEDQWNRDYMEWLFQAAAEKARHDFQDSTWQAFWRTAIDQESLKQVAADLGLSLSAVSMARRRVFERIQQQIQFLEGEL